MKHTPGPWTTHLTWSQTNGSGYSIAEDDGDEDGEEMKANARLISAAPEMLDALKKCVNGLGCQPGYLSSLALTRAQEAIAKAERK